MITSPDFCANIYGQLQQGLEANLDPITCNLPVVSAASNRLTLAAPKDECALAPHQVRLSQHPSGTITVGIESTLGMACPDPLVVKGLPVATANQCSVSRTNHSNLAVISAPNRIYTIGLGFDGEFSPMQGAGDEYQRLFVAQLAGLVLSRALRKA